MSLWRLLAGAACFLILACSQIERSAAQENAAPQSAAFEVASVKAMDPNASHDFGVKVYPGGRVVVSGLTLKALLAVAYRLSAWQISGGEGWIQKDVYKVEGEPAENLRSSFRDLRYTLFGIEDERLCAMLQTLLTDRFQLRFHRETRTGDVYLLERSGKALGLHPAEMHSVGAEPAPRGVFGSIGYVGGRWSIYVTSMPQLAKFAADFVLQAPVIDRTGLSGLFDYRQPVADAEPNYIDNTDSFLRFLTELGIRLKRAKGAVEMLVIDSASRPSAN